MLRRFATLLVGTAIVACSGAGHAVRSPSTLATQPSPAAATARPTISVIPDDLAVEPPRPSSEALSEASFAQLHRYFVIDVASGLVQPLGFAAAFSSRDPIAWLDDDTLWLDYPSVALNLDLDGSVTVARSRPAETFVNKRPGESPSGAWNVAQLASGSGGVIFSAGAAQAPRYRIANALAGIWSPTRDVALMSGNSCTGSDLFLFDPQTVALTNLTEHDDREYQLSFLWAPDGVRIAASARGGENDALVLIDSGTDEITTLAATEARADLRPIAWSPSGQRLLFYAWHGQETICGNPPYERTYLDTGPNLGGP